MAKEEKGFLRRDLQAENMQEYIYMLFKKDIFEEAPKNSEHKLYWKHTDKNFKRYFLNYVKKHIFIFIQQK